MTNQLQPNSSPSLISIDLEVVALLIDRWELEQTVSQFERCALEHVLEKLDAIILVADTKLDRKLMLNELASADELAGALPVWQRFGPALDEWKRKTGSELSVILYWTIKMKLRPSIRAILDNSFDFRAYYCINDQETKDFVKHLANYFKSRGD